MKHYIKVWYILCLLIGLFASCNDDRNSLVPTGVLYLNVEEDGTLLTRVTTGVTYESLQVAILQGEEDTLKVYKDYLTEVKGQRLVLPIGKYTVAVRSNGADEAGWETPLYMGQEEVEVKQGEISNTKVVCKIANTMVSVVYGNTVKEHFSDYQTAVSNASGSLTFTRDEYRSGFFTPEKLTVQLNLVNNDGNTFVLKRVYPDIQPQYHYTFEFTISGEETEGDAGADFDIDVDDEHQEITYNIFIKKEDLAGIGKPSVEVLGFTDGVYTYKNAEDNPAPAPGSISMQYKLGKSNKLQSFKVTVDSPTFPELSSFDLTKDEDKALASSVGFPQLPDPIETSDRYITYQMDLSTIVTKLDCVDDKPTVHTFSVDLLDDKYQEESITFAIKIMPDVAAYVEEPYCWSTFAVLKGNCISTDCYFKLQIDGEDEINIKDMIRDDNGNVSSLIIGLKPNVKYSYRLVSDEDDTLSCEPKEFTLSEPSIVPNLYFDNWGVRTGTMTILGSSSKKEYISPNSNDVDLYWESGNLGATAGTNVVLANSTNITKSSSSTLAAILKSAYPSQLGIGAFAAGSLFSGYAKEVSSSGAVLMYGRPYNGYPTKLRGYYKYTPETIDDTKQEMDSRCPVDMKGKKDQALIYIALIPKQFEVVSKTSGTIVSFSKENARSFAYGEYIITETKNETGKDVVDIQNGYEPFEITLQYDEPTPHSDFYIVIVATSSRYGDYFTGAVGSTLYIDDFELDYNYNPVSFSTTTLKDMNPININD